MEFYILSAIFFPILFSPLFFLLHAWPLTKRSLGFISAGIAALSLIFVIIAGMKSQWNFPVASQTSWVPSLEINLSFITDGLSLFFGILISAFGILVNCYAQFYMSPDDRSLGRFYCCFTFFMGAMIGTVFSNNLLVLFFFWELTGLASFLLIGYHDEKESVDHNAKTTLLVTSLTGLALLTGIILLGQLYGSYDWMFIVKHPETFQAHPWLAMIIILLFLIGIFGKSAQFPFYFWLPKAMVAPTPVSAYLHAATMVKLGIFLVARMYPLFVSNPIWFPTISSICFLTMLIGAFLSLISHDLKAVLAYATISQLGFFIGFYGIGDEEGVSYDFVHILTHTLYKGSLFMLVGIVNHATGIRDIRRLGGLFKLLPFTALLFLISTAAMAGLPGTIGFLSKEMILADVVVLGQAHHSGWVILGILFTASLFKVAFSIRLFYHLFARERQKGAFDFHPPGWAIQIPPAILSAAAFIFGVWPTGLNHLVDYFYVSGLHVDNPDLIKIWHGWTIESLLSLGIFALGTFLFYLAEQSNWYWTKLPKLLRLDQFYDHAIKRFQKMSISITRLIHSKRADVQLTWLLLAVIGLVGWQLLPLFISQRPFFFQPIAPIRLGIAMFVGIFSFCVVFFKRALFQLIALSASGFALTLYFVLYEAPDLAMTQILIETMTLFLILIFFHAIDTSPPAKAEPLLPRMIRGMISLGMGGLALLTVQLYDSPQRPENLKHFFLTQTVPLAHGKNAVNTILVDFRGLDTLGEVSVLIIACLGVIGLLTIKIPFQFDFSGRKLDAIPSVILRSILPFIFFLVSLFGIYLLVRGHDAPGGGFAGGLCFGIAMILIGIVKKLNVKQSIIRLDPLQITFVGLSLILMVGGFSLLKSQPFLTHEFFTLHVPFIGNISLNTPLLFDIGVFLIVVGMTVKTVFFFRNFTAKEEDKV